MTSGLSFTAVIESYSTLFFLHLLIPVASNPIFFDIER
jgi:hypothetical protein